MKARQIGASETLSYEMACRAAGLHPVTFVPISAVDQMAVGPQQDAGRRLLRAVRRHSEALSTLAGQPLTSSASAERIVFRSGAVAYALPGSSPSAMRGFSGDLVLDELAHVRDADDFLAAAIPIAALSGRRISVASTPAGPEGRFAQLAHGSDDGWSRHSVSVHDALRDGAAIDVERLRDELGDEIFAVEFELSFASPAGALVSAAAVAASRYDGPAPTEERIVHALDVGRLRDASSLVSVAFDREGTAWVVRAEERRNVPFHDQIEWVLRECRGDIHLDVTGMGGPVAEELERQAALRRVPLTVRRCTWTAASRTAMLGSVKRRLETQRLRTRAADHALRKQLAALRVEASPGGSTRIVIPRDTNGHGDSVASLAMVLGAEGDALPMGEIITAPDWTRRAIRQLWQSEGELLGSPRTSAERCATTLEERRWHRDRASGGRLRLSRRMSGY